MKIIITPATLILMYLVNGKTIVNLMAQLVICYSPLDVAQFKSQGKIHFGLGCELYGSLQNDPFPYGALYTPLI